MPLQAPLSHAMLDALDVYILTIRMPNAIEADILKDQQALIERAIADVVGEAVRVKFRVESSAPRARAASNVPPEDPADLLQYASERIR
ncbi:MAG: hypothetical protein JOZ38_03265 [Candidatus Eremiobacteraeota bacterium]|nr:hypothetical protein [Candidatus Eremiobacteraeota bacterium]